MVESFEYKGIWWLPENEAQKYQGKLIVSQGKSGKLNLSTFELDSLKIQDNKTDLILGFSTDGKKITLYRCFETNKTVRLVNNGPSAEEFEFLSIFVFVGAHFKTTREICFKKLAIRYMNLDEWANISGFKTSRPPKPKSFSIKYRLPRKIKLTSNKGFEISITFSALYPSLAPRVHAEIIQKSWVEFSSQTSRGIEEFLECIRVMQNFLSLVITKPIFPLVIQGQSESEQDNFGEHIFYPEIEIYFSQSFIDSEKHVHVQSMLFTLKDIMKKKRYIKNWFEKDQLLKPTTDLYFSTLYQPHMYLNNEFLNLAQALETYHRRTMRNLELPESKHQKRIQAILKKTPEKYNEWLERELTYSNEPSLRKRLRDICEKCPDAILSKLGDINAFIDLTVNTRNYWTHFDERTKARAATDIRLSELVSNLRLLLIACLLKEMSVTNEEIDGVITKPFVNL